MSTHGAKQGRPQGIESSGKELPGELEAGRASLLRLGGLGWRTSLTACASLGLGVLPGVDAALFTLWAARAVRESHARHAAGRHRAQHHHLRLLQQGT